MVRFQLTVHERLKVPQQHRHALHGDQSRFGDDDGDVLGS